MPQKPLIILLSYRIESSNDIETQIHTALTSLCALEGVQLDLAATDTACECGIPVSSLTA